MYRNQFREERRKETVTLLYLGYVLVSEQLIQEVIYSKIARYF